VFDAEPVQAFDLPEDLEADRVVVYPNNAAEEPAFEAVPFVLEDEYEDGRKWYNEPEEFVTTDAYREAVVERADMDRSEVRLERAIPTYGYTEV